MTAKANKPILLTIGYTDILLPDDTSLQAILRALRKGLLCRDRLYDGRVLIYKNPEVQAKVTTVPAGTRIEYEGYEGHAGIASPNAAVIDRPRLTGSEN